MRTALRRVIRPGGDRRRRHIVRTRRPPRDHLGRSGGFRLLRHLGARHGAGPARRHGSRGRRGRVRPALRAVSHHARGGRNGRGRLARHAFAPADFPCARAKRRGPLGPSARARTLRRPRLLVGLPAAHARHRPVARGDEPRGNLPLPLPAGNRLRRAVPLRHRRGRGGTGGRDDAARRHLLYRPRLSSDAARAGPRGLYLHNSRRAAAPRGRAEL